MSSKEYVRKLNGEMMLHPKLDQTDSLPQVTFQRKISDRGLFTTYIRDLSEIIRPESQTMDRKKSRPQSWPECPASITLPISYVTDNGTQTDNTVLKHDHEAGN
ncbi:unnamed protein product [Rhizophagus irregularis]|nr:unnamed protein product [Rhizophagus irregularis]